MAGAAGERDALEARDWLERAAAQGIADAESDLAELARNEATLSLEGALHQEMPTAHSEA
jgi:TPR repeat protein